MYAPSILGCVFNFVFIFMLLLSCTVHYCRGRCSSICCNCNNYLYGIVWCCW